MLKQLQKTEKNPPLKQLFEILRLILIVLWLNILKKYSAIILVLLARNACITIKSSQDKDYAKSSFSKRSKSAALFPQGYLNPLLYIV